MIADELAARLDGVTAGEQFGDPVAAVDPERWADAALACRDELGLTYLDLLTGVDDGARIGIVTYLWAPERGEGLLLRTAVPAGTPVLDSLTPLFAGADWHERETAEMFGVTFIGHPNPVPLLLPDPPPVPTPLRKSAVLTRRADTRWPGAGDPA